MNDDDDKEDIEDDDDGHRTVLLGLFDDISRHVDSPFDCQHVVGLPHLGRESLQSNKESRSYCAIRPVKVTGNLVGTRSPVHKMGKHLQKQDSNLHFQRNYPGCLWTILHFLDYHHWHSAKHLFQLRSHVRLSHPKGHGMSKTGLDDHDIVAVPEYFNKEAQTLLVKQQTTDTVRRKKKSGKSYIKVPVAKEMIEEDSHGFWNLRHSISDTNKKKTDRKEPFPQKISKNLYECKKTAKKGKLEKQEPRHADQIGKDISDRQSAEPADVLEMFTLNEKLFPEMLRDEEVGPINRFRTRNSYAEVCLTKSMSFPAVCSSGVRFRRPCTLENKHYESFPKHKNLRHSTRPSKLQEWNHEVVNRLNAIKRKMKQTFKEKRKGSVRLSVNALSLIPTIDSVLEHHSDRTEIPESLDHPTRVEDSESNIKSIDETNGTVHSIKSIFFPYESSERCKDLFAEAFNDKTKYRHSRSLTLTSGNKILKSRLALRSFRRNLSSPDLEIFCSFFHNVSYDSSQTDKPIIERLNQLTRNISETDRISVRTIGSTDGFHDELVIDDELIMCGGAEKNQSEKLVSHSDDKEFWPQSNEILDIQTCSPDHPILEGMDHESAAIDGKIVSNNRPDGSSLDSIPAFMYKIFDERFKGAESNSSDNADLRDILELSWFIESEAVGTCRSVAESTSSLLDELEGNGKEAGSELDQQLLFDLINEALHDIDETSSTYSNRAFSFSCHVLPRPSGKRLVREVQKRVGIYFRPGHGSLEEVMAGDLCRGDGWMKIQLEAECLALEVEDLILDHLVDELMSS